MRELYENPFVSGALVFLIGFVSSIFILQGYKNNRRLINFIPHIWTALGVLGTFTVLFLTLTLGGVSFDSGRIGETIRQLTGAFSTSIVGIFFSLVFAIVTKQKLHQMDLAESEGKPWQKDPKELLYDIYYSLENKQDKLNQNLVSAVSQTNRVLDNGFEKLNTSVDAIESTINKKLKESLLDFHQMLSDLLANISQSAIDESRQQIASIYQNHAASIEEMLKTQNDLVKAQLEKMDEQYRLLQDSIRESGRQTRDETEHTRQMLKQSMDELSGHYQTEAHHLIDNFKQVAESVKHIGGDLQRSLDEALRGRIQELEATFVRIDSWQREIKLTLESTLKAFSSSVSEYQATQHSHKETLDLVRKQTEHLAALTDTQQKFVEKLGAYDRQMEDLETRVRDLSNVMKKLHELEAMVRGNGQFN